MDGGLCSWTWRTGHLAWVTRLERLKGAKDEVKQAWRAANFPSLINFAFFKKLPAPNPLQL